MLFWLMQLTFNDSFEYYCSLTPAWKMPYVYVLLSEDVIWTKRTKLMRQTNKDYLIIQEPGESLSQPNDFIMMQVQ